MSGSSFSYLCNALHANDVNVHELGRMRRWLETTYPSHPATLATAVLHQRLQDSKVMDPQLRAVWKAVEWYVSCDWGPESVTKALNEFSPGHKEPCGHCGAPTPITQIVDIGKLCFNCVAKAARQVEDVA